MRNISRKHVTPLGGRRTRSAIADAIDLAKARGMRGEGGTGIPPPGPRTVAAASGEAGAALRAEVLEKFREVFSAVRVHFDTVSRQLGVTGTELWGMWELQERPGQRVSDLAARLCVRQSTVSNFVERLSRLGLVLRKQEAADRRVVHLHLSAAGKRLLRKAPQPARGVLPEALAQLSPKDLGCLRDALASLVARLSARVPGAAQTPLTEI